MTLTDSKMRILFVGAVDFSRHCLNDVLQAGGNVVAAVTLAADRGHVHSDLADVGELARARDIPVHEVRKISTPENVALIRSLRPDIIFVFGWSQLISQGILDIPRLGCVGTHPALLPLNRGRHPLIWALVEGLPQSGLTFFYLDEGADSGDILWQRPFSIGVDDDAADLYKKIKDLASQAIGEFLPQLENGTAPRVAQDHSRATYWRKRTEADGEIDWQAPTLKTHNLIRALARPYVGAHSFQGSQRVLIWRAALPQAASANIEFDCEPGTVITSTREEVTIRTGDGYLRVLEFSLAGGGELQAGTRLEVSSCVS